MEQNQRVTDYIASLPDWQQAILHDARRLIHEAAPDIAEEIKFTNRPYFTLRGNVCAFLAAKDHVNIFIYDPIAPDPAGLINQGQGNITARSIQVSQGQTLDPQAFKDLIAAVAENNRRGGWRKLQKN